jgi:hypothetical protein
LFIYEIDDKYAKVPRPATVEAILLAVITGMAFTVATFCVSIASACMIFFTVTWAKLDTPPKTLIFFVEMVDKTACPRVV